MTGQNAFQPKYRLRGSVKLSIQSILRLSDLIMMQLSSLIVFCLTLNAFIIYIFKSVLWLCPITFTHAILAPHHHLLSSFICYDESTLGTCISSSCSATKLKPSPLDRAHKTTYGTFTFHFYPQGTRGPIKSRYGILSGNFWK